MAHIGIDLGTSNTLVAKIDSDGNPQIIEINNRYMIPSVVYIKETGGNIVAGNHALLMWADSSYDPDKSFRRWKLHMGEETILRTLEFSGSSSPSVQVTPEKLTTYMVEHVVKEITKGLGGISVESVLVTVPHGWRREHPEKCRSTRNAAAEARCAGKPLVVQQLTVSEPVAAAAYWLWEARNKTSIDSFTNKTLMVCDVGGGTYDISLVAVGDSSKPLDVIDAINNDYAGDYVDALICSQVCKKFNELHGTKYPESADEILKIIAGHDLPWLRDWFLKTKEKLKEDLSQRVEGVIQAGQSAQAIKPLKVTFEDPEGNEVKITMGLQDFIAWVEPFYAESRKLVRTFLAKIPKQRLPHALVFAGGGSCIYGLNEHVLMPVLTEFYSEKQAQEVLNRIEVNPDRLDQAIALGAALIANGIISVQERLLHDIGITCELHSEILKEMNLSKDVKEVLLIPLLAKGVALPASIKSSKLGVGPCTLNAGDELPIDVLIDADSQDPWIQSWLIPHPGGGKKQSVEWGIEADSDGALTVHILPERGQAVLVEGRLERKRTGRASIVIGDNFGKESTKMIRIKPDELRDVINKVGRKS